MEAELQFLLLEEILGEPFEDGGGQPIPCRRRRELRVKSGGLVLLVRLLEHAGQVQLDVALELLARPGGEGLAQRALGGRPASGLLEQQPFPVPGVRRERGARRLPQQPVEAGEGVRVALEADSEPPEEERAEDQDDEVRPFRRVVCDERGDGCETEDPNPESREVEFEDRCHSR